VPLGLPAHIAPQVVRRALVNAQHTIAFSLLMIAIVSTLVLQGSRPADPLWPAALALVPSLALLLLRSTITPVLWCSVYLLVSGLALHLNALVLLSQPIPINGSDGFSFLAVKVSIIMVGGAMLGITAGISWSIAGFVVAELAVGLARASLGLPALLDVPAIVALVATISVIPLIAYNSQRQRRAQPRLHRAAEEDQVADLRNRIEVKASTLMHDTVLNHLAAIAESADDKIDPALRESIQRDVHAMVGEEWLTEPADAVNKKARIDWQHSGLFNAIQETRLLGLDVETTGDLTSVGRLDRETSVALGLAVKQCLVNVVKHSGVLHAEVAVYGTADSVSVMVVDNGRGFTETAAGSDRLGLRSSVRKRMELVGGRVNVWSAPGRGTSVMIKVPLPKAESVELSDEVVGSS